MVPTPLVSIYIPTKGRPGLLVRALRSALSQDHTPIEVVVVVDGPDDNSLFALEPFRADPRVRIFCLPVSSGACAARNFAIRQATGEYVTGLDDDDEILPGHVRHLLTALSRSGASFSCTAPVLERGASRVIRHRFVGPVTLDQLLRENVVGNQVLARRRHLLDVGGFDEGMPAWQDFELWVRICERFGDGVKIDSSTYIQHLDHEEERISNPARIQAAYAAFVERHAEKLNEEHRASLELLMYATAHQTFPVRNMFRYFRFGYYRRATSALVSDRLPVLRNWARKLQSV